MEDSLSPKIGLGEKPSARNARLALKRDYIARPGLPVYFRNFCTVSFSVVAPNSCWVPLEPAPGLGRDSFVTN